MKTKSKKKKKSKVSPEMEKAIDREAMLNIVLFMKWVTSMAPFPYQSEALEKMCRNKRFAFKAGRQVGKTTITAVYALWRAFFKYNETVIILALTQRQSSLMFRKIKEFVDATGMSQYLTRETLTMLKFDNGSEIHCLPAGHTGDTVRGFSPNLIIIDEAAFVPDDVFIAIEPSLAATNGDLILLSTPFGQRGRFYEAFKSDEWSKHHAKSSDCPLITKDFLDSQRASMTENEYIQEFKGEFIAESDAFFSLDLVLNCVEDIEEITRPSGDKDYYLGVDCARFGTDETVYIILEVNKEDNGRLVAVESTSKKPLTDVVGRVKNLNNIWHFRNIYIDETGLGGGVVDSLMEEPNIMLEPVTFTLKKKESMYKNLKLLMEQRKVRYPHLPKLLEQLKELTYKYSASGHLMLSHPERGHDDYPDALALSCLSLELRRPVFRVF